MSAWEGIPAAGELDEIEMEEWLTDLFDDLRADFRERRFHDRDGYLCDLAGSEQCLALGHRPDENGEWELDDDHQGGWDGDVICPATKYATACTSCESADCPMQELPNLWALASATPTTEGDPNP